MTLTLFALFVLILCFKFVLHPKSGYKLIKNTLHSEEGVMLSGVAALAFALLIFSTSGIKFTLSWESSLTWIGVFAVAKGLMRIYLPSVCLKWIKRIKAEQLPIWGFFGLAFALALIYLDTQILV